MNKIILAVATIVATAFSSFGQQTMFSKIYFDQGYYYPYGFNEMADSSLVISGAIGTQSVAVNSIVFRISSIGDSISYFKTDSFGTISAIAFLNDSQLIAANMFLLSNNFISYTKFTYASMDTSDYTKFNFSQYPNAYIRGINKLFNNDIIITNMSAGPYSVLRVDSTGAIKWSAPSTMPYPWYCKEDYEGNIILCGNNGTALKTSHLQKMDSAGNILWHQSYGNNWQYFSGYTIGGFVQMNDSNYLISCVAEDYHLIKINRYTGDTIWTRTTNSMGFGFPALIKGNNNQYVATGLHSLYFFDDNGDTLFTRPYNLPQNCYADIAHLIKTKDGGFAYCGSIRELPSPYETIFVGKTDSLGNTIFTSQIEIPNETELLVYPNPTSDILNFNLPIELDGNNVTITVYDALGSEKSLLKYDKLSSKQYQFDCSSLPNGLYSISMQTEEKRYWQKFVVQR
ncbi:MAG: T9SS type A sorting domain-containing protein [Bacteroidetes bacterium]|nr:T9SS type A sorting domain-containing protein [Bacteroidota bacterium]